MDGIRAATLEDAKDILAIYEPYILNTTITYEYETVSIDEFRNRMIETMQKHPWIVYEVNGVIAGYAYASTHRKRAAYGWDCEVSVYLDPKYQKQGIASKLYEKLLSILQSQGYVNVYSFIDYPNESSYTLHKKFGFNELCIYKRTAYKFGAWRDLLVMEKSLIYCEEPSRINNQWEMFV